MCCHQTENKGKLRSSDLQTQIHITSFLFPGNPSFGDFMMVLSFRMNKRQKQNDE